LIGESIPLLIVDVSTATRIEGTGTSRAAQTDAEGEDVVGRGGVGFGER